MVNNPRPPVDYVAQKSKSECPKHPKDGEVLAVYDCGMVIFCCICGHIKDYRGTLTLRKAEEIAEAYIPSFSEQPFDWKMHYLEKEISDHRTFSLLERINYQRMKEYKDQLSTQKQEEQEQQIPEERVIKKGYGTW